MKKSCRFDCGLLRLRAVILIALLCAIAVCVFTSGFVMFCDRDDYLRSVLERERALQSVSEDKGERTENLLHINADLLRRLANEQADSGDISELARRVNMVETLQVLLHEMMAIKRSMNDELVNIEARRARALVELRTENETVQALRLERDKLRNDMDAIRMEVKAWRSELHYAERDRSLLSVQPLIYLPLRIGPFDGDCSLPGNRSSALGSATWTPDVTHDVHDLYKQCTVDSCIDFSRCSITQHMPVYVYAYDEMIGISHHSIDETFSKLQASLLNSRYVTRDPDSACLFLVLATDRVTESLHDWLEQNHRLDRFSAALATSFRHFAKGNHVLLFAPRTKRVPETLLDALARLPVLVAHSGASRRPLFDVTSSSLWPVLQPPFAHTDRNDVWRLLPTVLPARRRFMASFHGSLASAGDSQQATLSVLRRFAEQHKSYNFEFDCPADTQLQTLGSPGDWLPCYNTSQRSELLRDSSFCVLLSGVTAQSGQARAYSRSSELTQLRLLECLLNGAVPVVLDSALHLPYDSQFNWQRATIRLPVARVTELHTTLASLTDDDIVELRRTGRLFVEQRLATASQQLDTLLDAVRSRLAILPRTVEEVHAPSVFDYVNETESGWSASSLFKPTRSDLPVADDVNADETIGPRLEASRNSPAYRFNYTQSFWMASAFGGALFGADSLFPYVPFMPTLPSDAKFRGSAFGFRPLNNGLGGAGAEFSLALGGNRPYEQFTAVILSYERDVELILALRRLKGVPYLHSVLVVWNSAARPSSSIVWPDIGVPVHVVKPTKNSLNNRFLPYELVQTEAILCLDDDVTLRHDEVIFAFRAWRETPERVVGFPARYHAWHAQTDMFTYDSNYTCEYSMVLTGAAFVHKYYFYLYSFWQPSAVRAMVDEFMNCEDIAMNFLVSHVTRKPPVKVTSRWTFHCANCPVVLSLDETHFAERHACINRLTEIYGYNPLLMTQYRVDSVLFKTRIPSNKQKCFRYV